jgi:hypothetical protein
MKALLERLHELGYSNNMIFEYRSAEGRPERLLPLGHGARSRQPRRAGCGIRDPCGAGGEGSNHNHPDRSQGLQDGTSGGHRLAYHVTDMAAGGFEPSEEFERPCRPKAPPR